MDADHLVELPCFTRLRASWWHKNGLSRQVEITAGQEARIQVTNEAGRSDTHTIDHEDLSELSHFILNCIIPIGQHQAHGQTYAETGLLIESQGWKASFTWTSEGLEKAWMPLHHLLGSIDALASKYSAPAE